MHFLIDLYKTDDMVTVVYSRKSIHLEAICWVLFLLYEFGLFPIQYEKTKCLKNM